MGKISEWKSEKEWWNPVSVLELIQKVVRIPNGTRGPQTRFASVPFVTFLLSSPAILESSFVSNAYLLLRLGLGGCSESYEHCQEPIYVRSRNQI